MRAFFAILVLVVAAYVALPFPTASAAAAPAHDYLVVVNPANGVTHASRKFVGAAFLKKTTRWPNGEVIRPVDQAADSEVRRKFTEDVLNRSVAAVRSYWQQLLFAGRDLPPPELGSNDEIVSFVAKHEGAIGYVAGNAKLSGVKALTLE